MKITINGETQEFGSKMTVHDLLVSIGVDPKRLRLSGI